MLRPLPAALVSTVLAATGGACSLLTPALAEPQPGYVLEAIEIACPTGKTLRLERVLIATALPLIALASGHIGPEAFVAAVSAVDDDRKYAARADALRCVGAEA